MRSKVDRVMNTLPALTKLRLKSIQIVFYTDKILYKKLFTLDDLNR